MNREIDLFEILVSCIDVGVTTHFAPQDAEQPRFVITLFPAKPLKLNNHSENGLMCSKGYISGNAQLVLSPLPSTTS